MNIKTFCAAAALAVGVGSAADAASVRFDLIYQNTILENATIRAIGTGDQIWDGDLDVKKSPWALPTLYPGAKRGNRFEAYAEIVEADDEYGGYFAPVCDVGGFDCSVDYLWERFVSLDPFAVVADAFGVWQNGKTLIVTSWGDYDGDGFEILGDGYEGYASAITTTFRITGVAPVPLPTSVALLPLGFGALAMLRRRRRVAS